MSTEKQREGSRTIALPSTTPTIHEGIQPSQTDPLAQPSQAKPAVFVSGENLAGYEELAAAWFRHYKPRNPVEVQFVRQAVDLSWMIDRAKRHEAAHLSRRVSEALGACEDGSSAVIAEAADLALFDSSNQGERIRRGLLTLQRDLIRTVDTITKMREREAKFNEVNISVNQPVAEEVRPESVVEREAPAPVEVAPTPMKAALGSAATPSPVQPEQPVADLFDGIPPRVEPKEKRPARRPDAAKVLANHRRGVKGPLRPLRTRPPLDLLLNDNRSDKSPLSSFINISCMPG